MFGIGIRELLVLLALLLVPLALLAALLVVLFRALWRLGNKPKR